MVPANSCRIPRVPHYSGVKQEIERFHIRGYHALWQAFPHLSVNFLFLICLIPRPRLSKPNRFRLFRVRSPLLAESLRFLFLRLLRCFSSPGSLLIPYVFRKGSLDMTLKGFPHSGTPGSTLLCSSPGRFAAYAPFFGNLSLGIHHAAS